MALESSFTAFLSTLGRFIVTQPNESGNDVARNAGARVLAEPARHHAAARSAADD